MPKDFKLGSWEVRAKACHKTVAKLKLKEMCAVLPLFEESLPRPKCSSHVKNHQHRFGSLKAYSIGQPESQPLTDCLLYIEG